jgi:hypothetical protein
MQMYSIFSSRSFSYLGAPQVLDREYGHRLQSRDDIHRRREVVHFQASLFRTKGKFVNKGSRTDKEINITCAMSMNLCTVFLRSLFDSATRTDAVTQLQTCEQNKNQNVNTRLSINQTNKHTLLKRRIEHVAFGARTSLSFFVQPWLRSSLGSMGRKK